MILTPQAQEAYRRYRDQRFFGSLNGVRFLCIVMVMWHHGPANDPVYGLTLTSRGFTGVDFFFVLSGFLITTLLLREEARTGRISIPAFYVRRALRILPVYFLVVTAVAGYYVLWKGEAAYAPLVPYYYLFLANFLQSDIPLLTITWSLSVEEQYYLVWPALLVLLPVALRFRGGLLVALIGLCVLTAEGLLAALLPEAPRTEHAIFRLPVSSYAAILIGSLLAVGMHAPRGFALVRAVLGWRHAPIATFVLLAVLLETLPGVLTGWPNLVLHSSMALCLAAVVVREDHALAPALRWGPVARIGEISYGIYLYHLIARHIATETTLAAGLTGAAADWTVTLGYMLLAVVIADLSFRFYETPFLRLKEGLGRRRTSSPSTAP